MENRCSGRFVNVTNPGKYPDPGPILCDNARAILRYGVIPMGIIDGLLGNATELDLDELDEEFFPILAEGESIQLGYKVVRDLFVFTSRRLILVDKPGLTGKRIVFRSIPYLSIAYFEVETNGYFDVDAELRIWVSGNPGPIVKDLKNRENAIAIQKSLAAYTLA